MRERNLIWMMVFIAVALIAVILVLTLSHRQADEPSLGLPEAAGEGSAAEPEQELDPFCPSRLQISTFVVTQGTKDKGDDEVFISVTNPDKREYRAKVYVNQALEGEGLIPAESELELKSTQMTSWWTAPTSDEEDAEVETIDITKTNTFIVDVRVQDCEKQIALLSPDSPISASAVTGGGGGDGGAGGGGGGTTIKIVRTENQNLND